MSIWGRRDSEPPAEEAHESQAGEHQSRAEAHDAQEPAAEHQAEELAPAFWRAQGETPTSLGRDPADAPPPAYGEVPASAPPDGAPASDSEQVASESPAGADAPVPVLAGVVIDGETAVKDPALTGIDGDQAGSYDAGAGPAITEVQEPTVAAAREPVVNAAQESPPSETQEPTVTEVHGPSVAEAQEPAVAGAGEPAVAEAQEPVSTGAEQLAAAAVTPQRWSEILVAFVDDPRGSVQMAAGAVDEAINEFVNSIRARQRDLASTWQGGEAGTEQLRTALREYRKLGQRVQQLELGDKTAPEGTG